VLTNFFSSPGMTDIRLGDAVPLDPINHVFRGPMQYWLFGLPEVAPRIETGTSSGATKLTLRGIAVTAMPHSPLASAARRRSSARATTCRCGW
jgi:hypothetical protein